MKKGFIKPLFIAATLFACSNETSTFDASGAFEATETIVSSEASGKIMALRIEEGQEVKAGEVVGFIDSTQLFLTRLQLIQNRKAILSGRQNVKTQVEALQNELDNAVADKTRIENLVKGQVASQKQLDDAITRVDVIKSRLAALNSTLSTNNSALTEQGSTLAIQLQLVEDQLRKCKIVNPSNATVLVKYSNAFEMTSAGKPIYKIADLSSLTLRAYVSGDQLSSIKLGQKLKVIVDDRQGGSKNYEGSISWISDKAEFTPKTIQTKEERANLVYAVKIIVKNDGFLKIGMYADVLFGETKM